MSHGHCNDSCCGTEQDMQKKEMLQIAVSFILLAAGIFLSAADVPFFRDGRIRLVW